MATRALIEQLEVKTMPRDGEFCTVSEAADELGVSASTIWRWIENQKLPAYRVGPKAIRIRKDDLKAAVAPVRPKGKEVSSMSQTALSLETIDKQLSQREMAELREAMHHAKALRERILKRRKGQLLPSSTPVIREARDERAQRL